MVCWAYLHVTTHTTRTIHSVDERSRISARQPAHAGRVPRHRSQVCRNAFVPETVAFSPGGLGCFVGGLQALKGVVHELR